MIKTIAQCALRAGPEGAEFGSKFCTFIVFSKLNKSENHPVTKINMVIDLILQNSNQISSQDCIICICLAYLALTNIVAVCLLLKIHIACQEHHYYLCASFRILGVPSNRLDKLSGATIKTLAMLGNKVRSKLKGMPNKLLVHNKMTTYMPNNSNFSSTEGALKLRTNSPYSVMSRLSRSPPLQEKRDKTC